MASSPNRQRQQQEDMLSSIYAEFQQTLLSTHIVPGTYEPLLRTIDVFLFMKTLAEVTVGEHKRISDPMLYGTPASDMQEELYLDVLREEAEFWTIKLGLPFEIRTRLEHYICHDNTKTLVKLMQFVKLFYEVGHAAYPSAASAAAASAAR